MSRVIVQWWGLIPFVLMLLSIAVFPLVPAAAHIWENPRNQLMLSLVLGVPVAVWFILAGSGMQVLATAIEYTQFIMLLLALFVVSGGIYLRGDLAARPATNTAFLAVGGLLASFIGTTGAAMLLIRPILNTNRERRFRAHTVVFTILVVANCGGVLTPLGDPPLFLGFLRGVPFTWTFHLIVEWLFVNAMLLGTYFLLDRRLHSRESAADLARDETEKTPLRIDGAVNFAWFALVIAAVAAAPSVDIHAIEAGHAEPLQWLPLRELIFAVAALASLRTTSRETRYEQNSFSWSPIAEVAALFVGIFLTMMPALRYLEAVAPKLPLNEVTFFVFSGGLSSVLDNAPTYATFFSMAAQLPGDLRIAGVPEPYLVAISLGSVFCGAITYIGNGPNFMVKSVAESRQVCMPSFGGYMVWTMRYLVPVLAAMVMIFVVGGPLWSTAGVAIAALSIGMTAAGVGTPALDGDKTDSHVEN
ncbi:sodium:proton antiporter [Dermatophilus congolensis]|uniref:sodium:proton antiporter n=1 Tax=Dermatophilus congolensis TaxID=1863 RepID=UPI00312CA31B